MYDVVQGDDVCVLELLEQGCLSYGGEGSALLLLQADLLQGNHLVGQTGKKAATFRLSNLKSNGMMSPSLAVPLEDGGVGSLPQLLQLDVGLQFPEWRIALQKEWGKESGHIRKGNYAKIMQILAEIARVSLYAYEMAAEEEREDAPFLRTA